MKETKSSPAKEARNAYARKWRAKNPDKVKAAQERYWDRVAERAEKESGATNGKEENTNEDVG